MQSYEEAMLQHYNLECLLNCNILKLHKFIQAIHSETKKAVDCFQNVEKALPKTHQ